MVDDTPSKPDTGAAKGRKGAKQTAEDAAARAQTIINAGAHAMQLDQQQQQ